MVMAKFQLCGGAGSMALTSMDAVRVWPGGGVMLCPRPPRPCLPANLTPNARSPCSPSPNARYDNNPRKTDLLAGPMIAMTQALIIPTGGRLAGIGCLLAFVRLD